MTEDVTDANWWTSLSRLGRGLMASVALTIILFCSQFWMCSCQGPWCKIRSTEIGWLTIDGRWVPTNNELVSIPVGVPVTLKFEVRGREIVRVVRLNREGDVYMSLWTKRPYLRTTGIQVYDPITGQFLPEGSLHWDDIPRGDDQ